MGNNSFAPFQKLYGSFIVQNIASPNKVVRIFNYPILPRGSRDLLAIPGVGEDDIRASLLKGELLNKLLSEEIVITASDIDLLQFNSEQMSFLRTSGVVTGLQTSYLNYDVIKYEDIELNGTVNGINTVFTIPSGTWIQSGIYKIIVYLNGVKQAYPDDYSIVESKGIGTGYDTVIFVIAPSNSLSPTDRVTADYYVDNS